MNGSPQRNQSVTVRTVRSVQTVCLSAFSRARGELFGSETAAHGYSTIYLFTPSAQDFFSRLGWSIVEHTRYRDADVTIMSHTQAI